jgi:methyl halide transferase
MNDETIQQDTWQQRYRSRDIPWDRGECSPVLLDWLDEGRVQGRVLVPGCGRGHEVIELCARGFEVTAIDYAAAAIESLNEQLEARGLRANTICEDFLTWQPNLPFDTIFEQTSLCALPPASWSAYQQQLHRWLAPDRIVLALFMQTGRSGGPPWHLDLVAMQRLFRSPNWRWLDCDTALREHPSGLQELPAHLQKIAR